MRISQEVISLLKKYFVSRHGTTTIDGSLFPSANEQVDLGRQDQRFGTIYARNVIADTLSGGGTSDTVDGYHANASPTPNTLLPLDALAVYPDSVYPNALLRDGTRSLTGNLTVAAGITIDGVDISAHAADGNIHHLSGMSADDHSQYVHISSARTIVARHTFNPGSALSPFILGANAQNQLVTGLYADSVNKSVIAGAGLTGGGVLTADRTLNIGAGLGITVNADDVALTTPGTLTAATTNSSAGNHTHNITSYADSTIGGQANHILQSDSLGDLKLHKLTLTDRLSTPLIVTESGYDLILDPATDLVKLSSTSHIQVDGYVSQTTGWRISNIGEGDFRYLYTDELHARTFIADLEQALAGLQIITKSVAILATDFTAPAAGAAATIWVEDLPGAPNMAVFQSGDIVRVRTFDRTAGSLTIADAWGVVTAYADGTGGNEGLQSWTFTRSTAGNAGSMVAATVVPAGQLVLDYGTTGNGFHEVNALDGAWGLNSPYAQTANWTTHPATGTTVRTRTGNLRGIFGVANEFGSYMGDGAASTNAYIRISNQAAEIHNIPLNLYDSTTPVIKLVPGASPYISIGSPAPAAYLDSNAGLWVGKDADSLYKFRLGAAASSALTNGITWDGYTLTIKGTIVAQGGVNQRFEEFFDGSLENIYPGRWTAPSGPTVPKTIVAGMAGGQALSIGDNSGDSDYVVMHSNWSIPYDPTRLYRIIFRVKRTAGTGTCYLGVAGRDATDTLWVSSSGANSISSQHYIAASGLDPVDTDWHEYVGYFIGNTPVGTNGTTGARPSSDNPAVLHTNVRYFRPILYVNYASLPGTYVIDEVRVEIMDSSLFIPGTTVIDGGYVQTNTLVASSSITVGKVANNAGRIVISSDASQLGKIEGIYRDAGGVDTVQAYFGTDGKIYAGGGNVSLDSLGMKLITSSVSASQIKWYSGADITASIYSSVSTGNQFAIWSYKTGANIQSYLKLVAKNGTAETSLILYSHDTDGRRIGLSGSTFLDGTLTVGSVVGTPPPAYGDLSVMGNTRMYLGLSIGGIPAANAGVGDIQSTGGIYLGANLSSMVDPGNGNLRYTGNLYKVTLGANHIGGIYVPLGQNFRSTSFEDDLLAVGTYTVNTSAFTGLGDGVNILTQFGWSSTAGIKAWHVRLVGRWTSAGTGNYAILKGLTPYGNAYAAGVSAVVANQNIETDGIIIADSAGDFAVLVAGASGYITIELVGYFI